MDLYKSTDRGRTRTDWLDSRHSFSFGGWVDPSPRRQGFRALRVLNEDRVAPGTGFGPHPHRDMEIVTILLAGALEHRDSSGARTVLRAGDVQRMSAGRGVVHSEWNHSDEAAVHLLQIWLHPRRRGEPASHEEGRALFPTGDAQDAAGLRALVTPNGTGGSLRIHADAEIHAGRADRETSVHRVVAPGRGVWIQAVRGELDVEGTPLAAGDGLAIEAASELTVAGRPAGDFILFDLA